MNIRITPQEASYSGVDRPHVISPFAESLANDVREGLGMGALELDHQRHVLWGLRAEQELCAHEMNYILNQMPQDRDSLAEERPMIDAA